MNTITQTERERNELAKGLVPLVYEVARQVARRLPSHVMLEDLIGAGMLGLAGALDRFDPERAETFKGYAEFRIRGAIIDDLRRRDIMSRDARIEAKKLDQTIERLRMQLAREPGDDEVADHVGVSLDAYRAMQVRLFNARLVSIESMDLANSGSSPSDAVDLSEMRDRLVTAIRTLPRRQQTVLSLFYFHDRPLREIADLFGVSPSRICQIRTDAVKRLRAQIHEEEVRLAA